jgi:hypothetical protein
MCRQPYTSSPQIIPPDRGLGHLARSGLLMNLIDIPSREIRESLSRAPLSQIVTGRENDGTGIFRRCRRPRGVPSDGLTIRDTDGGARPPSVSPAHGLSPRTAVRRCRRPSHHGKIVLETFPRLR